MELESCGSLGQLVQAARSADDEAATNFRGLRARAALCYAAAEVADADVSLLDWWEAENELLKARAARVRESARVSDPAAPAAVLTLAAVRAVRDAFAAEVDFAVREFLKEWDRQCQPADEEDEDMATATKSVRSKSGRRKGEYEAWYTEQGELWVRCPDCRGAHNRHAVRKCPCDGPNSLFPPAAKLQAIARAAACDDPIHALVKPQLEIEGDDAPLPHWPGHTREGFPCGTVYWVCPSCDATHKLDVGGCECGFDRRAPLILDELHVRWLDDGETAVWDCPVCGQQGNALLTATCRGCGRTRTPQVPMPDPPRKGASASNGKAKQKGAKGAKSKAPEPLATRTCNRCNTVHEAAVCPDCGCPEYRLGEAAAAASLPSVETSKAAVEEFVVSADRFEEREIAVADIDLRDDNPRGKPDQAAIEQLADKIREVGLINRVVLRHGPIVGRFEVWAGESRLRAVRDVLGARTIPAKVYAIDSPDELMRGIRAWENLARKDLNPIQEAEALRDMLQGGGANSQRDLAKKLRISQTEVSLRLRLVQLPAEWQQRVIAREISTSHVKHLYPYIDLPAFGPAMESQFANVLGPDDPFPPEKGFAWDCAAAARSISRPISAAGYNSREACAFQVTKELRAELDVRDVPRQYGGGKAEPRAFNIELWERLQKQAKAAARKKAKIEQVVEKLKSKKKTRVPEWDRTPNPYRLEHRLDEWAAKAMAPRLRKTDRAASLRLLLVMVGQDLKAIGEAVTGKAPKSAWRRIPEADVWRAVREKSEKELVELIVLAVQAALADGVSRGDLKWWLGVAGEFGVDLKAEWRPEVEDLMLYKVEQLRDLAKQFGHGLPEKAKDQKAIAKHLVSVWRAGDVPKEFLKAAGVK